jgi:hypothetical protein
MEIRTSQVIEFNKDTEAFVRSLVFSREHFRLETSIGQESPMKAICFCVALVNHELTLYKIKLNSKAASFSKGTLGFDSSFVSFDDVFYIAKP